MASDLTRMGFVIENEWYWKLTEYATTLDAAAAARDFLTPLARLAMHKVAIADIATEERRVCFALAEQPVTIELARGVSDRIAINGFVADLNRALAAAPPGYAFALVVPRRYELRGVLLTDSELTALAGDPAMLVPSSRPSWRAIPPS